MNTQPAAIYIFHIQYWAAWLWITAVCCFLFFWCSYSCVNFRTPLCFPICLIPSLYYFTSTLEWGRGCFLQSYSFSVVWTWTDIRSPTGWDPEGLGIWRVGILDSQSQADHNQDGPSLYQLGSLDLWAFGVYTTLLSNAFKSPKSFRTLHPFNESLRND